MKKINDNTVVRVRVPKHLYEAIQAKLALRENYEEMEEAKEEEKPKYAGVKMSKKDAMNKIGKGKTNTVKGKKAQDFKPVHANEGEEVMSESLQDLIQSLSDPQVYKTLGLVATSIGLAGGGKALADMIKRSGADISGTTGAAHGVSEPIEPEINENISQIVQDTIQWLSSPEGLKTLGVLSTVGGMIPIAKKLADKIKSGGSDISGITGAEHG
jgi:hypothetical protein